MARFIVSSQTLEISGGRMIPPGAMVPEPHGLRGPQIEYLISQKLLRAVADAPGTPGHAFIEGLLGDLDRLPATMEECLPGSSIHAQHTTLRASEATLNRVAPRVVAIREILAGVTARLTSADESSNFAALAPDVAAEYVLRPLLMDLMAEESRAETAAREARRAMKVEWERAEKLIAQLREQAPLATRFRISEQRDLITRLVGWPAPATVA